MEKFKNKMSLRESLDHHVRNLVCSNEAIIDGAIHGDINYDANKLREQTKKHIDGIISNFSSLKPDDIVKLQDFCDVAQDIPIVFQISLK